MLNSPSTLVGGKSFANALKAASEVAGNQNYPLGSLYVVATPIGNLADITLRALHLLQMVELIACEDSRQTQVLLRAYGIDKTPAQLLSVHQHNEAQAVAPIVQRLQQGQRVAYVSDAGTPGVSDPGAKLAAGVRQAGFRVVPLPGANSALALLSAAGLAGGGADKGFVFNGFLPSKSVERAQAVLALSTEPRAVVLLEAPHRIRATADALALLGERRLSVGRELTKQFEQITSLAASEFASWLALDSKHSKGEFTLVLHPATIASKTEPNERILRLLMAKLPLKTAVELTAVITQASRNMLYQLALSIKAEASLDDSQPQPKAPI